MEKIIFQAIVIIVLITVIGINVSEYMNQRFQIECVKSGGSVEKVSIKYSKVICVKAK